MCPPFFCAIFPQSNQPKADKVKTIADFIAAARIQLQDTLSQRYEDSLFRLALDIAFDEAYRIRPDMFMDGTILPSFITADLTTVVPVPRGYQSAFLYYICGHVQLTDEEDTTDSRAAVYLNKFTAQLLTTAS